MSRPKCVTYRLSLGGGLCALAAHICNETNPRNNDPVDDKPRVMYRITSQEKARWEQEEKDRPKFIGRKAKEVLDGLEGGTRIEED